MRQFSIILLSLCISLSIVSKALTAQDSYSAPDGFFWRSIRTDGHTRLELWTTYGAPTEIYFVIDSFSQQIIESQTRDSIYDLYIPAPDKQAYAAHPEMETSLEDEFLKILVSIGYPGSNDDNWLEWTVPESEELESYIQEIRLEIKRTEDWALESLGLSKDIAGRDLIKNWNPVEAIQSREGGGKNRLDAFNLRPLKALSDYQEEALYALSDLAACNACYLIQWFVSSTQYSLDLRRAILMLATHNHLAEDWFIRAVAAKFGVETAWKAFQDINKIYQNERIFWKENPGTTQAPTADLLPSHMARIKNVHQVNVSPMARVLAIHYGDPKLAENAKAEVLPYVQLYHYYGAFILSSILIEDGIPRRIIPSLARAFGLAYKLKTAGYSQSQVDRMLAFYGKGADHYLFLEEFIR